MAPMIEETLTFLVKAAAINQTTRKMNKYHTLEMKIKPKKQETALPPLNL